MNSIKKLLVPLASLRLTVALLLISMILVLAGTTAQRDMGIQDVQHQFFHSWVAWIQFHYFQPTPKVVPDGYIHGSFPIPGGYSIIVLMLANLLAAHAIRFRMRWNRAGIILIHFGLVLLLVGEFATSLGAVESQMTIDVGGSSNHSQDIRDAELAIVNPTPDPNGNVGVTVISRARLLRSLDGEPIHDPKLPFDVKVDRWYDNSLPVGPQEHVAGVERLATAGVGRTVGILAVQKYPGTEAEKIDMPSAFVTFSKNGRDLGTYLVSEFFEPGMLSMPMPTRQEVKVDGKTYDVSLRFRRDYKPYTIHLNKFTHDVFLGTDVAKDFASDIRLVDPVHHVNRAVRIWMNHPLRYNGETFYQQSFSPDNRASVLQIVRNPAWRLPYIACAIGALGLVLHFGMTLFGFLRRNFAPAAGTVGAARRRGAVIQSGRGGRPLKRTEGATPDRYTLAAESSWADIVVPIAIVMIALMYVISRLVAPGTDSSYHWKAFGQLPISFEGRVQPLQSLAINTLKIVSGHDTFHDENGDAQPQSRWLLETMTQSGHWADYPIFNIDHDQLKDLLKLPVVETKVDKSTGASVRVPHDKYYSWNELFPRGGDNFHKLEQQIDLAAQVSDKDRDLFQNHVLDLAKRLNLVSRLQQVRPIAAEYAFDSDREQAKQIMQRLGDAIVASDPQFLTKMQAASDMGVAQTIFNQGLSQLDPSKLTPEQADAYSAWLEHTNARMEVGRIRPEADLFLCAPLKPSQKWEPLRMAVLDGSAAPESGIDFLKIVVDFEQGNPANFNADVAAYQSKLDTALPAVMNKVGYETFFNQFDPFLVCMALYVMIFVLAISSWLVWKRPLWRSAFALVIVAILVHTFGLASRIYLSGRPPVTNLYSSAVFIAWAMVLLAIGLEIIFRNGIGLAVASIAGFTSLLVAAGLSATEGDTMKQLQAVLDTNFWLATHVVCVTLGYASTFLAGSLAIAYVLLGVGTPVLNKENSKSLSRMIYGILCFAILFSFVGTILGGIWADQSWGRFWGWDPKENGAVLIVLWNALILHARWSGMVRERGVAVLAVLGNIVTSWSWFGTNMLGIGLHSYGFMASAQFWLIAFMVSQVAIVAVALIPRRYWVSERGRGGPR